MLYENGDQYLFDNEMDEEEGCLDFGEDREELTQLWWNDMDMEHAPIVSEAELPKG